MVRDAVRFISQLQFGWRDALDIAIVGFIIYSLLMLLRGTRAMQMSLGILAIGIAYFLARVLDLIVLETFAREFFFYLPFAIIVLFQHDIRRVLASVGRKPLATLFHTKTGNREVEAVLDAAVQLAKRNTGALIVFEQTQDLRVYAETGVQLDSAISVPLLLNIFSPNTPLHDGAVLIRGNRILAAATFLPLSTNTEIASNYGTRHRAAIGLSEETDAVIIVVSEENGSIGVAIDGMLQEDLRREQLREVVEQSIQPRRSRRAA